MAILVDYSAIAVATVFSQKQRGVGDLPFLRHMILNSLRMYHKKYRDEYGQMVLACDTGTWRKDLFPEYKAARRKNREESNIDWVSVYEDLNQIRDDLEKYFPYKVIAVPGAEGDDVIGALVESFQEFGQHEPAMIISADKDFIQLQKYSGVKQFSPMTKKLVTDANPMKYLFDHILKGDAGDGVPNVLSPDNVFVVGGRQTPLRAPVKKEIADKIVKGTLAESDPELYARFIRNANMIDLTYIPTKIKEEIIRIYNSQTDQTNKHIRSYLIENRCGQLIDCASDFYAKLS